VQSLPTGKSVDAVRRLFAAQQIPLEFSEGIPNFQPRNVRITEWAPIVRWRREGAAERPPSRRSEWTSMSC
jgi:hypothetical protein